jgi:CHAD domain-containing protein
VLAYLWEQADAIRAADPQIRQDAPDSVHSMRVACRRMRSTLQSFRTLLDRDGTDGLVAELRWLAGELGGSRDIEVQEERIGRAVAALPPEIALGPVAAQVTRFFGRRRPTAGAAASAALDSDRYLALLDAIDALLADHP